MGSKSEALAKQFEAKARDAMTTLEGLGAEDWKKTTAAEKWSVGVTAHHLATALGPISGMIRAVAVGQSPTGFDLARLDEMNAQHARDHADCTKAETIELHRKGVAMAAETIRGLSDEQLAKGAPLMAGAPPMTAEELITLGLLNHIDEHFGSIRRTVGLPDGGAGAMRSGGFSKARLGRMREVMAGHVERGAMPGLVTLVSRRDEVHVEALGRMATGGRPMERDTIFRIASMTKPVAAAAAMILVEECRLRLDEPVDRLLPELADRRVLRRLEGPVDDTVPASRSITLRDLLTFRLGLGIIMAPPDTYPIQKAMREKGMRMGPPRPQTEPAPDAWMQSLGALPLLHQPGERWMYDTGSDVLGVLIARAAGQAFETFLRARLFEPLGMKDTGFSVPADKIGRLATSYWSGPKSGAMEVYDPAEGGQWSRPPAFPSAAGGLVSTVDDYLAFGRMLLNRGRHGAERILSRLSVEAMTTDQLTPEQKALSGFGPGFWDSRGWGFGLSVITRRDGVAAVPGRFGWDGGLGTSWSSDPTEELVGILMTQRMWTSPQGPDVYHDFWTQAYQAIDD